MATCQPPKEASDLEYLISVKKSWQWHDHKVRLTNLTLLRCALPLQVSAKGAHCCAESVFDSHLRHAGPPRFKPEGTVAAKFGYQFIKKIDVTKKGYYTLSVKASAGSDHVSEVWELHSKGREAQEQCTQEGRQTEKCQVGTEKCQFGTEKCQVRNVDNN